MTGLSNILVPRRDAGDVSTRSRTSAFHFLIPQEVQLPPVCGLSIPLACHTYLPDVFRLVLGGVHAGKL